MVRLPATWAGLGSADQGHLPDSDDVIGVSGEEGLAVSGPSHGETLGSHRQGVAGNLRAKLLNLVLAFEVPDLDRGASSGAEPVPIRNRRPLVTDNATYRWLQIRVRICRPPTCFERVIISNKPQFIL